MADNVVITAGTGTTVAADEVVDGTLGTVKAQFIKLMDGTLDGTAKAKVGTGTPVAGEAGLWVKMSPDGVNANGQATMANSAPTVLASDQSAVATKAAASAWADGADTTFGAKADAKSTATDTTAITAMQVLKQISASVQAPPSQAVTNAGTFATQAINGGSQYETVAVSQSNQVMGATGATGDYLSHVIVSPITAGCGVVTILDNATAVASFPGGGTTALSNLIPFVIPIGIVSTSGAWKITTGANVTAVGVGRFT